MQNIVSKIDKSAKIAVLVGGMSSEAEISKRSGKGCFDALKSLGYVNAELVVVDENIAQTLKTASLIMHIMLCTVNTVKTDAYREF